MSASNTLLRNPFDHNQPNRPLRILSLDGGGVIHGLSALVVLGRIMDRQAALSLGDSTESTSRPCEHFDLIVGSGTGGIVALLLGPLQLNVHDATTAYVALVQSTFGRPAANHNGQRRDLWAWLASCVKNRTFSRHGRDTARAGRFEHAFRDLLQRLRNDPELGLLSPISLDHNDDDQDGPHLCRTAVTTAVDRAAAENLLRSYPNPIGDTSPISPPHRDVRLWEAALATVTTFAPGQLPGVSQFDAGARNPTQLAVAEAERVWPGRPLGLIISLGAREAMTRRMRSSSNASTRSMEAAADGVHEQISRESGDSYFRFDVGGLERLDGWVEGDRGRVVTAVESWMRSRAVEIRMENCVDAMLALAQWIPPIPPTPRLRQRTLDSTTSSIIPLSAMGLEGVFPANGLPGTYTTEQLTGALAMTNLNTLPDGFPHPLDLEDMESRDTVPPTPPPRYRRSPSTTSSARSSISHSAPLQQLRRSFDLPSPYMSTLGSTAESDVEPYDSPSATYLPCLQEDPVDFTTPAADAPGPSNHRSASISSGGSSSK